MCLITREYGNVLFNQYWQPRQARGRGVWCDCQLHVQCTVYILCSIDGIKSELSLQVVRPCLGVVQSDNTSRHVHVDNPIWT